MRSYGTLESRLTQQIDAELLEREEKHNEAVEENVREQVAVERQKEEIERQEQALNEEYRETRGRMDRIYPRNVGPSFDGE